MKLITLSQGYVAKVDDEDYEFLNQWKWSVSSSHELKYAIRKEYKTGRKGIEIRMHRLLMAAPDDLQVDHKNHDGLDNQKKNLRLCTHSENCMNRRWGNGFAKFKGVTWHKCSNKWQCRIKINGISIYLGLFETAVDAARKYDIYAKRIHKKYAVLNFPYSNVHNPTNP